MTMLDHAQLLDEAGWSGRLFTGAWEPAAGGTLPVLEPASGEQLGVVGRAAPADVADAALKAGAAQPGWAAIRFDERAAVLRRAGDLVRRHRDEIGGWLIRETGSTRGKAEFELDLCEQECHEAAALCSQPYGSLLPTAMPGRLSLTRRVPVGVVGVITPWNAPLVLGARSVAPALALGNAVLLKPDPNSAVSGGVVFARLFEEAGLPPGVLHVLPGLADSGEALVADPQVRLVSFTGSTAAGRAVGVACAKLIKRALLELGGNNAMIVLADADIERAAASGAFGSFQHQGQICMTTGRHIVHHSIVKEYVEALAERANRLTVGDPGCEDVQLGPLINDAQLRRVQGIVSESIDRGAQCVAGGSAEGLFYRPTVLTKLQPETPAWAREVFGPVAPVMSFRTEEEAVALANATEYGLSAGIHSADIERALELGSRVHTGLLHINDQTVHDEAHAPLGGVGASGTTRFGGAAANCEAFTDTQWMTVGAPATTHSF